MQRERESSGGGFALDLLSFVLWMVVVLAPLISVPLGLTFVLMTAFSDPDPDSYSTMSGVLEAPYAIELEDGRRIEVLGDGFTRFDGSDSLPEQVPDEPRVGLKVPVTADHWWQQAASLAVVLALAAIAWFVSFQLWRVVRSAREGDPFSYENVHRLRWVAGCLAGAPLVLGAASVGLGRLMTAQVPATLVPGPGWSVWVIVALGVLAIAEVFRVGVNLRDLNERTV